jgi:hypothetical protein
MTVITHLLSRALSFLGRSPLLLKAFAMPNQNRLLLIFSKVFNYKKMREIRGVLPIKSIVAAEKHYNVLL